MSIANANKVNPGSGEQAATSAESLSLPRVELHGFLPDDAASDLYGVSTVDGVVDVTRYVTQLTWMHSTRSPWESITVDLCVPWEEWQRVLPGPVQGVRNGYRYRHPSSGFWVVIRHYNADMQDDPAYGSGWPAVAWGWCKRLDGGIKVVSQQGAEGGAPGMLVTKHVRLQAVSWIHMLNMSRIVITPSDQSVVTPGFWYNLKAWADKIDQIVENGLNGTSPGELLEKLWIDQEAEGLCHMMLPNSLASGIGRSVAEPLLVKDQIPVIWDRATCAQYAPQRLPQHIWVPGSAFNAFGNTLPRGTLWQWIRQTFAVDERVVELFPVLSYPSKRRAVPGRNAPPFEDDPSGSTISIVPETGSPGEANMTALGKALGAQPALMYRLKPMLLAPLTQTEGTKIRRQRAQNNPALSDDDRERLYEQVPFAQRVAQATGKFTSYGQQAIEPSDLTESNWYSFDLGEITEFDCQWDEDNRVNAVYVKTPLQPTTQMELHGLLGVPVISERDVRKYGLRMYDVEWPFLPSGGTEAEANDQEGFTLTEQLTALIDLFYAILGSDDESYNFGTGRLVSKQYKPWIKAGNWVTGELPEWERVEVEGAGLGLLGGDGVTSGFTAYAHTVVHSVTVQPNGGAILRETSIEFERLALFGPKLYPFPFPLRRAALVNRQPRLDDGVIVWGEIGDDGVWRPTPGYDPFSDEDVEGGG